MSTNEILLKEMEQIEHYSRDCYESYNRIWKRILDDHQREISGVTFTSELDFVLALGSLILERNEYGKKYDELIEEIDKRGKKILSKGAGGDIIKRMSHLIDEVIKASRDLDIEVDVAGDAYGTYVDGKLGDTVFNVSSFSKYTKEWWNDKYYSTPEGKEMLRERAEREKQQKQRAMQYEQKRNKEALMFLLNEKLNLELPMVINTVNELSSKIEANRLKKTKINEEINELSQNLEEKKNKLESYLGEIGEAEKEKVADLEVAVEDYQQKVASLKSENKQIEEKIKTLSIFSMKEKKQLTAKKNAVEKEIEACLSNIDAAESQIRETFGDKYDLIIEEQQSIALVEKKLDTIKEKLRDMDEQIVQDVEEYNKNNEFIKKEKEKLTEYELKDPEFYTSDSIAKHAYFMKDAYLRLKKELPDNSLTISEYKAVIYYGEAASLSNSELSVVMNNLVKMGLFTKTVKDKKSYFGIHSNPCKN